MRNGAPPESTSTYMTFENPADFLPHKPPREYSRRQEIYDSRNSGGELYMVVAGRVKISIVSPTGAHTVVRLAGPGALFGESSLVSSHRPESAVALDRTAVISWTPEELEHQINLFPALGKALSLYFISRSLELRERIVAMAAYGMTKRVILSLLQLSASVGAPMEDGSTRIGSLTQYTLAEYVGTSREMLSLEMNKLKRLGMIRYSRQFIDVYTQALEESLLNRNLRAPASRRKEIHQAAG